MSNPKKQEAVSKLTYIVTGNGTPGICEQVRINSHDIHDIKHDITCTKATARYWIGGTFFLVLGQYVKYIFERMHG